MIAAAASTDIGDVQEPVKITFTATPEAPAGELPLESGTAGAADASRAVNDTIEPQPVAALESAEEPGVARDLAIAEPSANVDAANVTDGSLDLDMEEAAGPKLEAADMAAVASEAPGSDAAHFAGAQAVLAEPEDTSFDLVGGAAALEVQAAEASTPIEREAFAAGTENNTEAQGTGVELVAPIEAGSSGASMDLGISLVEEASGDALGVSGADAAAAKAPVDGPVAESAAAAAAAFAAQPEYSSDEELASAASTAAVAAVLAESAVEDIYEEIPSPASVSEAAHSAEVAGDACVAAQSAAALEAAFNAGFSTEAAEAAEAVEVTAMASELESETADEAAEAEPEAHGSQQYVGMGPAVAASDALDVEPGMAPAGVWKAVTVENEQADDTDFAIVEEIVSSSGTDAPEPAKKVAAAIAEQDGTDADSADEIEEEAGLIADDVDLELTYAESGTQERWGTEAVTGFAGALEVDAALAAAGCR
ncbi:hypothetical protein GPECTOR_2g1225 [Gonium pectorale]|uniref:Uncharacterized protein n=1 Tax=Gonium pectorale TaxID=33097 RepID=A0A150H0S4_GONPE|nr:hypothetical protein GPECTOR_2g1225 [Gonium pectorale]|eukprot:KXZ55675.1 hypothetical protein GPECTOR_2g1225 [Gonium pectorale]